jgi:hypothetical protein
VGAAAALLSIENVGLLAGLLFAGTAPVAVLAALLLKFWLCVRLLKLRLGALVTLILWESFTMAVALVNTSLTLPAQIALFISASVSSTLLALSIPLYAPDPDRLRRR